LLLNLMQAIEEREQLRLSQGLIGPICRKDLGFIAALCGGVQSSSPSTLIAFSAPSISALSRGMRSVPEILDRGLLDRRPSEATAGTTVMTVEGCRTAGTDPQGCASH